MSDAPPADFPAAHSMDSAWFAVDEEGRVARFDTGEDGAIPNAAAGAGGNYEPDFDLLLFEALLAGLALREELERPPAPDADAEAEPALPAPPPAQARPERVVIVGAAPAFRDGDAGYRDAPRPSLRAEATFREGELVVVKEAGPRVLASRAALDPARVASLRAFTDATVLVESDLYYLLREGRSEGAPEAGVFEYRHEFDGKGSGTYGRSFAPRSPVSLGDVHPSIREKVGRLRLPVRFADSPVVELADHMAENDVQTWGTPLDPANAPPPPERPAPAPPSPGAGAVVATVVIVAVLVLLAVLRGR